MIFQSTCATFNCKLFLFFFCFTLVKLLKQRLQLGEPFRAKNERRLTVKQKKSGAHTAPREKAPELMGKRNKKKISQATGVEFLRFSAAFIQHVRWFETV